MILRLPRAGERPKLETPAKAKRKGVALDDALDPKLQKNLILICRVESTKNLFLVKL